ncbi:NAD(P)-dependent oxidoreductase [Alphaproteobacteria bacterium]|jgi:nucleoside-diphosphate-sugar epimerase|nr:NAD(P)-dependent oxidoreductase [Alphaproteobacteria bacterium]MDB9869881.1 NAD(P)-dependent oxidoreductase [Alphaproteobacteria bacterium]MDC1209729.1 NAD(P)-dependent oxidoreductase [Pseudomonadota bacterium]
MTKAKIFVTGGSGKAGKHLIPYLLEKDYSVVNADLVPLVMDGVDNINLDITDSGQVFNALSGYANIPELKSGEDLKSFKAVVHLAAIPRILVKPDNETFRINTLGTYNVIEAATKLGIKKIIFASSETTYGFCFSQGNPIPKWLPIEEDYETNPTDSYGLSKVLNEQTGKAFQKRTGIDIYGLRIGNIIEPDEYNRFEEFCKNPSVRLRNLFNYIDARDLAQAIELCIKKDGLGYEVFNVTHDINSVSLTTEEIIKQFFPNVKMRREMKKYESILSSRKIRDVLGFNPMHDWKKYLKA